MPRKRKNKTPPAEGAAFAVQLDDGRFGVCRVLRNTTSEEAKSWGAESALVACSAWIGSDIPNPKDPALRPILHLTHHPWKNQPEVLWVSEPPPDEFIPLGTIEPTLEEKAITSLSFGGWGSCKIQPLAQWRWDHDREAVLAEDAVKKDKESQRREQERKAREESLRRFSLNDLRDHQFLPRWKTYPPKKAIQASRQIMTDTVQQLIELGPDAAKSERMAVLQRCIESFNDIDAKMKHFIETIEREDICEEFEAIVHACGLGNHENLADEWRDW